MIKKLLFIVTLLLPLTVVADENTPKFSPTPLELNPISAQANDRNLPYLIEATYPELKNSSLRKGQQQLNELVANHIQEKITEFKTDAADARKDQAKSLSSAKSTLFINYDSAIIEINNKPIVSIRFKVETFLVGMAHPTHQFEVINYDLAAAKILNLSDIFLTQKAYLEFIADYCTNELKQTIPPESFLAEGATAKEENYKNWNLRPDGLLISFNEYQVAPYSFGPQTVLIPYGELKGLLGRKLALCGDEPGVCSDVQLG